MRWYVMDPKTARYFEKEDGCRVWHLSRQDAMRLSEGAIVVSLDERNFGESLNAYHCGRLFEQIHYDPHLGWVS